MINERLDTDYLQEHEVRAKKISNMILEILNGFVVEKRDLLQLNKANKKHISFIDILFSNRWTFACSGMIIISIFYLIVFIKLNVSDLIINIWSVLILLLTFVFGVYICYKSWKPLFVSFKEVRTQAISRVSNYALEHYYQIIEELGETFHEEYLNREEVRFQIAIVERKKTSSRAKKAIPLMSIFIVAFSI